ncbi:MAG TPA: FadR/GntR family transcriptional regulator [Terriglobales bacterium]|nr:FadR/GntR family transcriptional regulator [Terriglobales bacterium]
MGDAAERRRVGRAGRGPTVTDEAIARIREMIVSGQLRPGDRLPREADLALQLGLSRNSLREAVRALSLIRVLEVRHGDGTYISSLEPDLLLETTTLVTHLLQEHTVLELFEVRRLLEPAAAALAAVRMNEADRGRLRVELDRMLAAPGAAELVDADMAFHAVIAGAAGNTVLSTLLDGLSARTMRARLWRGQADEQALAVTVSEHVRIYEAIMSRDPELTRALAAAHIATGELWLRLNLGADAGAAADAAGPGDGHQTA